MCCVDYAGPAGGAPTTISPPFAWSWPWGFGPSCNTGQYYEKHREKHLWDSVRRNHLTVAASLAASFRRIIESQRLGRGYGRPASNWPVHARRATASCACTSGRAPSSASAHPRARAPPVMTASCAEPSERLASRADPCLRVGIIRRAGRVISSLTAAKPTDFAGLPLPATDGRYQLPFFG